MTLPRKPFIIAEIGSNWATFDHCLASIDAAKEADADAVKFQYFTGEKLYGPGSPSIPGELPTEWVEKLKVRADEVGIEFMCSIFDHRDVPFIDQFVNYHKVASAEITYIDLIKVLPKTKPVFISTGGARYGQIRDALIETDPNDDVYLLHCVAEYPARDANLPRLCSLMRTFGLDVAGYGFSDHTTTLEAALRAFIWYDVDIIEKHMTAFPGISFPDSPHSIWPEQFENMVKSIREIAKLPAPEEREMKQYWQRRETPHGCYRLKGPV